MQSFNRRQRKSVYFLWSISLFLLGNIAQPVVAQEKTPPFQQPNIKPTLRDFMSGKPKSEFLKIKKTDPLLRPPFCEQPVDSVKGLAAKIRAEELDTCNRVKAVRYLGTVDCKAYPEAQEQLIDALHNDKYEVVRYEAALALQVMLCGCADKGTYWEMMCDPNWKGDQCSCKDKPKMYPNTKKMHFISGRESCGGCCNKDVLNALAKTAFERDEKDPRCCFEPSARVRHAARDAIDCCSVCCRRAAYAPYGDDLEKLPEEDKPKNPVPDDKMNNKGEVTPGKKGEETPGGLKDSASGIKKDKEAGTETIKPKTDAVPPKSGGVSGPAFFSYVPHVIPEGAPKGVFELECIKGYCIVGLHGYKFERGKNEFWSVYGPNIYYFSSAEAKETFDQNPAKFAVKYAGMDIVSYCENGGLKQGTFMHKHPDGSLYMFENVEHRDAFKNTPEYYLELAKQDSKENNKLHQVSDQRVISPR